MSLLTPAELLEVQKVAELGMVTPVAIYRRTPVPPGSDEYEDELAFVLSSTVMGWLTHQTPVIVQTLDASAIVSVSNFRLFVPIGTDVLGGDRVLIAGEWYVVSDTSAGSTWPAVMTVMMRRRE